jgi:hypothetical protein
MNETALNNELNNLLKSFSELPDEEQIEEIENKIKTIIAILNTVNQDKNLLLTSTNNIEDNDANLTKIFSLLCCLEEEIGKLLINQKN